MITSLTDERATYDQYRSQEEPEGSGCHDLSRLPQQKLKQKPKQRKRHRHPAREKKPPSDGCQTPIETG